MMQVFWTKQAKERRYSIFTYIAQDNLDAARELDLLFEQYAGSLIQLPNRGRVGRIANTRELVIKTNYVMVYRIVDDTIQILTIYHGAQKFILLNSRIQTLS